MIYALVALLVLALAATPVAAHHSPDHCPPGQEKRGLCSPEPTPTPTTDCTVTLSAGPITGALTPGATVCLRAGTYPGFSSSASGWTLQPYPGEMVTISDGTRSDVIRLSSVADVVIRGLTVRDAPNQWGAGIRIEGSTRVLVEGNTLSHNRSFGLKAANSTRVTVRDNDITRNETGIEFSGQGEGSIIEGNRIFDHRLMVVDVGDPLRPGSGDRGANGMNFYRTTGRIDIRHNDLWANRAASTQFGRDGGSFEIYGASNLYIYENRSWDTQNVVETGTSSSGPDCNNLNIYRNVSWGSTGEAHVAGPSHGLILRCATNSLVAHNTFYDYDSFGVYITGAGAFAGGVDGLRVVNNIFLSANDKAWSLGDLAGDRITLDHNLGFRPGGGSIAWVKDRGNTSSLSTFQSWTGFEPNGLQADPRLGDDFSLLDDSPAIDAGMLVAGINDDHLGAAPDLGAIERQP